MEKNDSVIFHKYIQISRGANNFFLRINLQLKVGFFNFLQCEVKLIHQMVNFL